MAFLHFAEQNSIAIVQTGVIAIGPLLTAFGLFLDARARRVANLIQLTQQHRDLWERMYSQPELARILDPDADLTESAVTAEEEMFVTFLILHLNSAYYAMRAAFFPKPERLRRDIELFFSLPIPRATWEKMKVVQDARFVKFVEQYFSEFDLAAE